MKIWEVCKKENINKHYLDSNNNLWEVISVPEDSEDSEEVEEIELISNTDNSFISDYYYVSELLKLEFKLINNRSEE